MSDRSTYKHAFLPVVPLAMSHFDHPLHVPFQGYIPDDVDGDSLA